MAAAAQSPDQGARVAVLSATYSSPSNGPFEITRDISVGQADPSSSPAPSSSGLSTEQKTKFLQDLRTSVVAVQEQVNKELTARMEEDKARESSITTGQPKKGAALADETMEEENYGEEVVDEDD